MRVERQIDIDQAHEEVFAYVSDQLNAPTWQRGLEEVKRLTEGPIGIGTRHAFVRRFAGRKMEGDNEYVEYTPNRSVAFKFKATSGSVPGGGSYQVDALGPGRTRLTASVELHPTGLARLAQPLMSLSLKREVEAGLVTLKGLLEKMDERREPHRTPNVGDRPAAF